MSGGAVSVPIPTLIPSSRQRRKERSTTPARAQTSGGQVDVTVFAYEMARDQAFHFVTISGCG